MNLTYSQLLKTNRNFRNLLWGQFVSEMGNWFNFIAGLGLVRVVSDASPTAAGILFACRLLPFAVFSPIAGTFVDRFSRRNVMIFSDLSRVFVALAFLLVNSAENLWIAYLAMALLSTFGAFFEGAKNAATPNLTGKEGLLAGTALMFSTRFLLMAIGSALGGFAAVLFRLQNRFSDQCRVVCDFGVFRLADSGRSDARTKIRSKFGRNDFNRADYGGGRIFSSRKLQANRNANLLFLNSKKVCTTRLKIISR